MRSVAILLTLAFPLIGCVTPGNRTLEHEDGVVVANNMCAAKGAVAYSNDPNGVAPDLQAFLKGLGTNNETWSGVATQYCQGVALLSFSCPASNTQHVAYPTGGALAGVWEDTSAA